MDVVQKIDLTDFCVYGNGIETMMGEARAEGWDGE